MRLLILFLVSASLFCQVNPNSEKVKGYTKKNGTYVDSYKRTEKTKTEKDNYSSKPNVNPYTGKKGTKTPKR